MIAAAVWHIKGTNITSWWQTYHSLCVHVSVDQQCHTDTGTCRLRPMSLTAYPLMTVHYSMASGSISIQTWCTHKANVQQPMYTGPPVHAIHDHKNHTVIVDKQIPFQRQSSETQWQAWPLQCSWILLTTNIHPGPDRCLGSLSIHLVWASQFCFRGVWI